jgi:RimJ/RimL family protein N-acetyltransferase
VTKRGGVARVPWIVSAKALRDSRFAVAPTLVTARLTLRPYELEDFELLADVYTTSRSQYVGGPMASQALWKGTSSGIGQWPMIGLGTWALSVTQTGERVGEVAVSWPPDYPEPELGWLLFNGQEGQGYASEAAREAKRWAIDVRKVPSLVSYIDPDNLPSQRLANRLGGSRDMSAATPNGEGCWVFRYPVPAPEQADRLTPSSDT